MGYQKLKDGTWEQPVAAMQRVENRSIFNKIAAVGVAGASAALIYAGAKTWPSTPEPPSEEQIIAYVQLNQHYSQPSAESQIQDETDSLLATFAFLGAAVVGIGGGIGMGLRIKRDTQSKSQIQRDIDSNMMVDEQGQIRRRDHSRRREDGVVTSAPSNTPA